MKIASVVWEDKKKQFTQNSYHIGGLILRLAENPQLGPMDCQGWAPHVYLQEHAFRKRL